MERSSTLKKEGNNLADREAELFDGEPVIEFATKKDRRNFLKYAGMLGVGSTLAFVACGDDGTDTDATSSPSAAAPDDDESEAPGAPQGDLDILNYALTLEYLEADFYAQGINSKVVDGRELDIITAVGDHEAAHVGALSETITALGGEPVAEPKFKYPAPTFKDRDAFLKTASTFEELGVKAYHGQVTAIETPELLGAAASIAGVESRHASVIEGTLSMDEVLKAATPFIAG
jgi:rubrerythrin